MEITREEEELNSKEPLRDILGNPIQRYWSRKPKWQQILDEPGAREELKKKAIYGLGSRKNQGVPYPKFCRRCDRKYYTFSKRSKIGDCCKEKQGHKNFFHNVSSGNEVTKDGKRIDRG